MRRTIWNSSWQIARIAGIPIRIHWTFWLLLAWIVVRSAMESFDPTLIGMSVVLLFSVFICVIMHEYGHALTARHFGVRTIDIILTPIGGIARLVSMPKRPIQEFLVAIAGPAVNVGIAIVLGTFMYLVLGRSPFDAEALTRFEGPLSLLYALFFINAVLALFNLVPAFPMDGGRILRSLLALYFSYRQATRIAVFVARIFAIFFIVFGLYWGQFVLAFIGVFVLFGAHRATQATIGSDESSHPPASSAVRVDFTKLMDNMDQAEVSALLRTTDEKHFLVFSADDRLLGQLSRLSIEQWLDNGVETLGQLELNLNFEVISANYPIEKALSIMQEKNYDLVPVHDGQTWIGVLDRPEASD